MLDKLNEFLEQRTQRKLLLKQCRNCEIFSNLLENERRERIKLIELLKSKPEPESESITNLEPLKGIIPWAVKRHQLETASQDKARGKDQ